MATPAKAPADGAATSKRQNRKHRGAFTFPEMVLDEWVPSQFTERETECTEQGDFRGLGKQDGSPGESHEQILLHSCLPLRLRQNACGPSTDTAVGLLPLYVQTPRAVSWANT